MLAFHIAQGPDFRGTGANIKIYDTLVVNPSLPHSLMAAARGVTIKLDALLLGSFNMHMIPWHPANEFFGSLYKAMEKYLVRDKSGNPIKSSQYNAIYFWPTAEAYTAYAMFIHQHLSKYHLYLDDCTQDYPLHKWSDLSHAVPMNYIEWNEAYQVGLERFLNLIQANGNGPRIVANTAGYLPQGVTGICIEESHQERHGLLWCFARWAISATLSKHPVVNIDWSNRYEYPVIGLQKGFVREDKNWINSEQGV